MKIRDLFLNQSIDPIYCIECANGNKMHFHALCEDEGGQFFSCDEGHKKYLDDEYDEDAYALIKKC